MEQILQKLRTQHLSSPGDVVISNTVTQGTTRSNEAVVRRRSSAQHQTGGKMYATQFSEMEDDEANATSWKIEEYDRYGTDGGGNFVITGMPGMGQEDATMIGENLGREVETGSIGILSTVTGMSGGTFGSERKHQPRDSTMGNDSRPQAQLPVQQYNQQPHPSQGVQQQQQPSR